MQSCIVGIRMLWVSNWTCQVEDVQRNQNGKYRNFKGKLLELIWDALYVALIGTSGAPYHWFCQNNEKWKVIAK